MPFAIFYIANLKHTILNMEGQKTFYREVNKSNLDILV